MVSDPSELESQAFVAHLACYVEAGSGTLVLMIAEQVLSASHPVTFLSPETKQNTLSVSVYRVCH